MEQWRRLRAEIIEPLISAFNGRVVKLTGDGFLAEFSSAESAVRCAFDMQSKFMDHFADVPEARQLVFRMGLNLGEVYVDQDDDIYGTDVNVAARLEGIAEPGGIFVSDEVYRHVRRRVDLSFDYVGAKPLKNIEDPVEVYRVRMPGDMGRLRLPVPRSRAAMAASAIVAVLLVGAAGLGVYILGDYRPESENETADAGFPKLTQPEGHFRVSQPARLSDADALTIYERIRETMERDYARSGDQVAADYSRWRKYNSTPYLSRQHGSRYLNNYANDAAAAYGQFEEAGDMPPGAILVKDSFEVTQRGDVLSGPLFIMEKMPAGFNSETRDWRYIMIQPDGQLFGKTGGPNGDGMKFCVQCHQRAGAKNDHLFFLPEKYRRRFLRLGDE